MRRFLMLALCTATAVVPAFSQLDIKATVLKHLKTSEAFTLKVADAMPESDYSYKLTPPQMSFAQQLIHLSQGFDYFVSSFSGEKPNPPKPPSSNKADVVAFVKSSFDRTIEKVSQLTPDQLAKTYSGEEGKMTGVEALLGLMDHTTHHRACAEMYLRSKGITPPEYQF